ncbi:WxcM-like domain-containing protein, partial [Rhizobium johnstonii]|uniref:WxcM-like domain-containing protein n=1 Tax=Rhizobium johnstonii TaxID=3019933 RepID=UPI003F971ABC
MSAFTLLTLKTMSDGRGELTVMDGILPFPVVRSFWIYGDDGHKRGGHRHHQ